MNKKTVGFAIGLVACMTTLAPLSAQADTPVRTVVKQLIASPHALSDFEALSRANQAAVQKEVISSSSLRAPFERAINAEIEALDTGTNSSSSATSATAAPAYDENYLIGIERTACIVDVDAASCAIAKDDADKAESSALNRFTNTYNTQRNGNGDAYRHCYWNERMARTIGTGAAVRIAGNHEAIWNGPAAEQNMDRHNNEQGRNIGNSASSMESGRATCETAARASYPNSTLYRLWVLRRSL